jgi:SAM-dependent methyltransferase
LISGKEQSQLIRDLVLEGGLDVGIAGKVLDFGCGCGRLSRWLEDVGQDGRLFGCDYNDELVSWCRDNLPFLDAQVNGPTPPLPYAERTFDLVFALSIFTHLPLDRQVEWCTEIRRLLRPGGLFCFTVCGDAHAERLTGSYLSAYRRGRPVVLFPELPGTNLCAAHHPPAYVERELLADWEVVRSIRADLGESQVPHTLDQDVYLARRP